jgi:hypothetical protein
MVSFAAAAVGVEMVAEAVVVWTAIIVAGQG